jgi:hypothetical protein
MTCIDNDTYSVYHKAHTSTHSTHTSDLLSSYNTIQSTWKRFFAYIDSNTDSHHSNTQSLKLSYNNVLNLILPAHIFSC